MPRTHYFPDDRVHYTWDTGHEAALTIESGDTVVVCTRDVSDDQIGPDGLGNWWQYHEPRTTAAGGTLVTQRLVTEVSHRLVDEDGNEVVNWPPVRHDKNG